MRRAGEKIPAPPSSSSRLSQVRATVTESACPSSVREHLPLLGREVGEAVQVEVPARRPVLPGERLGQPGQPVPGVGPLAGGQGLVGAVDEREVPQLVPLRRLRPPPPPSTGAPGVMRQLLSSSTVASRPERKAGLREGRWYTRSCPGHRPGGRRTSAAAGRPRPGPGRPARRTTENTRLASRVKESTSAKSEHPAASDGAQAALHVVGVLLRDDQDLGPPVPARPWPQQCAGLSRPRPAQQQLEHVSPPILWSDIKLYHIPPRRAILDGGDFPVEHVPPICYNKQYRNLEVRQIGRTDLLEGNRGL